MPRKLRSRYREHECYYAEFAAFVGDIRADDLTGEHFRDYHDHVHRLAQAKAKPNRGGGRRLSNPDRWVNHRFGAVTTAFRRVKRRFPELA